MRKEMLSRTGERFIWRDDTTTFVVFLTSMTVSHKRRWTNLRRIEPYRSCVHGIIYHRWISIPSSTRHRRRTLSNCWAYVASVILIWPSLKRSPRLQRHWEWRYCPWMKTIFIWPINVIAVRRIEPMSSPSVERVEHPDVLSVSTTITKWITTRWNVCLNNWDADSSHPSMNIETINNDSTTSVNADNPRKSSTSTFVEADDATDVETQERKPHVSKPMA